MGDTITYEPKLTTTTIYGLGNDGNDYIILDAAVRESHEASITTTDHPVEFGANISDHAYINPRVFTLRGRISNTPLRTNSDSLSSSSGGTRSSAAWEMLETAMFKRDTITIDTVLKSYSDVVIERLSTEQDWQTARVLDFEMTLKEIFIVDLPTTEVDEADNNVASNPVESDLIVYEQAVIEENAGELQILDSQIWATDEQYFESTNSVDLRNVGLQ